MTVNLFKKGKISEKYVRTYVILGFISFLLFYAIFRLIKIPNYTQASIDVIMHIAFIGLLFFMIKKHGLWIIPYMVVSFVVIAYSEIQSVTVLNTYEYLDWPSAIFFEYPITIGIGWLYLSYSTYLLTNILVLNRENSEGFTNTGYLLDRPIIYGLGIIIFLAFIDGLLLFHFGVLNETIGIDLGLWNYRPSLQPKFFDTPTETLYSYFLASFIFNLFFRFIELIMNKYKVRETVSFDKSDYYPLYFFFLYWAFLMIEAVNLFGIDHWSIFVSVPILILIIIFSLNKFYNSPNK